MQSEKRGMNLECRKRQIGKTQLPNGEKRQGKDIEERKVEVERLTSDKNQKERRGHRTLLSKKKGGKKKIKLQGRTEGGKEKNRMDNKRPGPKERCAYVVKHRRLVGGKTKLG